MDREALRGRLKLHLDQLVDELLASEAPPRTIDEIEEASLRLREKAGQCVAQELTQASAEQAQQEAGDPRKVECSCGRWARRRGRRERDVVTLSGRLRVRRSYYYCRRCNAGFCLTDRALGLSSGPFTRRVMQEVVRLDALLPYQKAMELLFELTGVLVSPKEAQRMLSRAEAVVESYQQARWGQATTDLLRGKSAPEGLYLLADGVQTPMRGGWREMKVGVARRVRADGKAVGGSRYVSLLGEAEPFGWEWAALAEASGVAQAGRVVVLGDGAKWIWNQAALHFPDAIQILDVWHATQRLWEVGRLAFGEERPCQEWVQARQEEMWHYQTDALLSALGEVAAQYPLAREKAKEAMGYVQNNRERMDYPRYQQMGLQVGSGAVESACKQVVSQRLKGAGMRWREAGAQTVARLRCLLLGGEWHRFVRHWNQAALTPAF
jgi:hypothetical protein